MTAWLRMLDQIEISLLDCHFRWLHPHLKFLILPGEKWPPHRRFGHLARCFGSINLLYALIIGDPISTDVGNVRPSQTGAWLHWAPGFLFRPPASHSTYDFIRIYWDLAHEHPHSVWQLTLCLQQRAWLKPSQFSPARWCARLDPIIFSSFHCTATRKTIIHHWLLAPQGTYLVIRAGIQSCEFCHRVLQLVRQQRQLVL